MKIFENLINFIKDKIFDKKCPKVQCTKCKYFYYGPDKMRRCRLIDELKMN